MKRQFIQNAFIGFILLTSCNSNQEIKKTENKVEEKVKYELSRNLDDYPITDKMFYNDREIILQKFGSNSNWFRNDTLNEVLVFELYTDKHRMYTFHFMKNKIPINLLDEIPFNNYNEDTSIKRIKERTFVKFIEKSKKINRNYFRTNSGINLGDEESQIINKYGSPSKIETINKIEKLTWGETTNRIELYFVNKKLISIFIFRSLI